MNGLSAIVLAVAVNTGVHLPAGTNIQQVALMPGAYVYRDGLWYRMDPATEVTPASQAWHEGRTGARLSDEERARVQIQRRIRATEAERRAADFERERNAAIGWRQNSFESGR